MMAKKEKRGIKLYWRFYRHHFTLWWNKQWGRFKSVMVILFIPSFILFVIMGYVYLGALFHDPPYSNPILSLAYFVSDAQVTKMMNYAGTGIFFILFFAILLNIFTKKFSVKILTKESAQYILIGLMVIFAGVMVDPAFSGKLFGTLLGTLDEPDIPNLSEKYETLEFIALIMGGVLAVLGAITINRRVDAQEENNESANKRNDDYRFQHMVSNLGHEKVTVRVATFYRFYYLAFKEKNNREKNNKGKSKEEIKKENKGIIEEDIFEMLCSCLRSMSSGEPYISKDKYEYRTESKTLFDVLFKEKFKSKKNGLIPDHVIPNLQKIHLDNMDLVDSNLSRANLSHANLAGSNLSHTNLSHANLSHANLSHTNLFHANLFHADLSNTDISDAEIPRANLSHANLFHVNVSNANLFRANLSRADLWETNLSGARLTRANLSDAYLFRANLSGAHFFRADFSNANLLGTDLSGAYLVHADFSNADLSWVNLQKTELENANLMEVRRIKNADFRGAKIGDRLITKDDLPADKGEYYADWNPPPDEQDN